MHSKALQFFLVCLLVLPALAQPAPTEITIAAAADLNFALKDVAARYEKETGQKIKLSFGSSGNFYSQISNGAPFDLFFSADLEYPRKLAAAGLVEPNTLYPYAVGQIVVWVRNDSRLDLQKGLNALLDPAVSRIAIANPEHAPYGKAAVAAMKHESIYDKISSKLVLGENISQTAQFVDSGSADAGIIALSLAIAPTFRERGRYSVIATSDYPPIDQGAILLKSSANKEAARAFLNYLRKPEIVEVMHSYGFSQPGKQK
ncbi:MAG: molybdate ABC transporter substrate-binding protein [Candidatus Angelobacter sp. Gp1-AA117]|nr:MAG: molybdate ABC transporter substrate-binding protein [Candidatus Angelobacter sp. Gp1-AA117]